MYVLPAVLLRGRGLQITPPPRPNCATQTSWGFVVLHEISWTLRNQKWYLCAGAGAVKQQLPCPSAVCPWETGEAISGQTRLLCFPCLLDCYCHCYCYMSDDTAFGCRYQCAWLACSRIDPLVKVTDPWETPPHRYILKSVGWLRLRDLLCRLPPQLFENCRWAVSPETTWVLVVGLHGG